MANSINTKAKEYYDSDNSGGSLNSNLKDFLKSQGVEGKSLNTMWRNYANNDGGVSLNTRLSKLWGTSGSLMSRWHKNLGLVWDDMKLFFDFRNIRETVTHASAGSTSFTQSGDNYISVDALSSTNHTFSLWAYPTLSGAAELRHIVDTRDGGSDGLRLSVNASNQIAYDVNSNALTTSSTWDSEWLHICGTYDGTTQKLYINGVLEQSGATSQTISTTVSSIIGGRSFSTMANNFDGKMSNFGFWSRALSASEVQGIMYKKYADLSSVDKTSLVSWWGLDEDYTDSHGSNDGTNNGSTLNATVYGGNAPSKPRISDSAPDTVANYGTLHSGTALSFDGTNDYVDCGSQSFALKTHSFWFNPNSEITSATAGEGLFEFDGVSAYTSVTVGSATSLATNETLMIMNSQTGNGRDYITDNIQPNWHHIVWAWDGSQYQLYINGQNKVTTAGTSGRCSLITLTEFEVGRYHEGSSNYKYFNGLISSPKIFDVALTLAQIQEMYLNPEQILPTGVSSSNLKLWLPLQEGSGTTNYDGSGNNNDGTISGATWVKAETEIAQVGLVRQNKPMVFDGSDDKVTVTYNSAFAITNDRTVSIIARLSNTGSLEGLFSTRVSADGYVLRKNSDNTLWGFNTGGSVISANILSYIDDKYHHIVYISSDTSGNAIYIDGSVVATNSATGSATFSGDEDLIIGLDSSGGSNFFNGLINEVAIWDEVLDADAVTALYNSGTPLDASADSGNYASSDGLVGYWRNDGDTTWTDRSTNSNDGTVAGSPASIVLTEGITSGRDSQGFYLKDTTENCLTLNGAEYVEVPDSEVFDFGQSNFSIEYWINTSESTDVKIINQWNYSGTTTVWASSSFESRIKTNKMYARVSNGSSGVDVTSTTSINDGNWHHIVFLRDGDTLRLYIDSSQEDTGDTTGITIPNTTRPLWIGKDVSSGNIFFNGLIDDVRIYSKALSSDEVTKNYNAGKSKH